MILCLIILAVGVLSLIGGVILRRSYSCNIETIGNLMWSFGTVVVLLAIVCLIVLPMEAHQELNTFICQKEYIENYEQTSEYDLAAVASKKVELNEWLYSVQHTKEHYPICSFYGDEILELEPIK